MISNVQELVTAQLETVAKTGEPNFDVSQYHELSDVNFCRIASHPGQINAYLQALARERADMVTLLDVAKSSEGRTIHGVKVLSCSPSLLRLSVGCHVAKWGLCCLPTSPLPSLWSAQHASRVA